MPLGDHAPFISVMGALTLVLVALNAASVFVPSLVDTAKQLDVAAVPTLMALLAKSPLQ